MLHLNLRRDNFDPNVAVCPEYNLIVIPYENSFFKNIHYLADETDPIYSLINADSDLVFYPISYLPENDIPLAYRKCFQLPNIATSGYGAKTDKIQYIYRMITFSDFICRFYKSEISFVPYLEETIYDAGELFSTFNPVNIGPCTIIDDKTFWIPITGLNNEGFIIPSEVLRQLELIGDRWQGSVLLDDDFERYEISHIDATSGYSLLDAMYYLSHTAQLYFSLSAEAPKCLVSFSYTRENNACGTSTFSIYFESNSTSYQYRGMDLDIYNKFIMSLIQS